MGTTAAEPEVRQLDATANGLSTAGPTVDRPIDIFYLAFICGLNYSVVILITSQPWTLRPLINELRCCKHLSQIAKER